MNRISILASAAMALTLTLGAGCDKAADEQRRATAAQTESPESSEEFPSSTDLPEAQSDATLAPVDRPSDDGALIPATTDDVPVPF